MTLFKSGHEIYGLYKTCTLVLVREFVNGKVLHNVKYFDMSHIYEVIYDDKNKLLYVKEEVQ